LEILPISPKVGDALAKGEITPFELEQQIRRDSKVPSMRDNGLKLLAEGKTDLDALRKQLDMTYDS
jgi:type IV pilus assembly protein PilB